MSKITELASGQITKSDRIIVILVEPEGMPSSVIIHWPQAPSVLNPDARAVAAVAASVVRVLAEAQSRMRGDRRTK